MDNELFKQKLSEVADWKIPDTQRETSVNAKKRRGRKSKEEQYQEQHEEVFLDLFEGKNPSIPPMVTNVKVKPCDCEDCGKHCETGRQKEIKLYTTNRRKNWRERCTTCGMAKNPYTGKFDLTSSEASFVWNDFLRDTKGAYSTKKNDSRDAAGIIRINPEKPYQI